MKISKSNNTSFWQDLEFFYNLPEHEKPYMKVIFMKYFNEQITFDIGEEVKIKDTTELKRFFKLCQDNGYFHSHIDVSAKTQINKKTFENLKIFRTFIDIGYREPLYTIAFNNFAIGQFGYLFLNPKNNKCNFVKSLNPSYGYCQNEPKRAYFGIDCTRPFLHYGHLKTLVSTIEYLKKQNIPELIILLGTTTALIGDPTGQDVKRPLLTEAEVSKNKINIVKQINYFMDLYDKDFQYFYFYTNDYLKIANFSELEPYFNEYTVSKLIEANRMKKDGLTVKELIYPLLQAFDFVYLKKNFNCVLQVGGKDQEINMIYGKKMVKKLLNEDVEYKTFNLV